MEATSPPVPAPVGTPTRTKLGVQPEDIQPTEHETLDRALTGLITFAPVFALGVAVWQCWNRSLGWNDVVVFFAMYIPTGLGVTVGFHRYLTHRSFSTSKPMRGLLGILGSMAIEGPVISWVSDHRKHHAFADEEGDPHSPHVGHGGGLKGKLRGLLHAHVGWIFVHTQRANKERFAPDLLSDPTISWVDKWFFGWAILGLMIPAGLGYLLGGRPIDAATGLLWGGAVRMFVLHHVTYSINSLCHVFGRRGYDTEDESRNLAWLAPLSFGESWHNNHHAFPTSAVHGLKKTQFDISALTISGLEKVGLVWDVKRVTPERQAKRAAELAE